MLPLLGMALFMVLAVARDGSDEGVRCRLFVKANRVFFEDF